MIESRGWNIAFWLILMVAGGVLGHTLGYQMGGAAWSDIGGWLGFVVAVIGAGFMLLEKVEA